MAGGALLDHPRIAELYPVYLVQMHGVVRASVPLMEEALERARALAPSDAVAVRLAEYLEGHVGEERGHDDWLLEDLETLGVPRRDVLRRVPSPSVAALVGSQYYWIRHDHPVALLGYIALLEGSPPRRSDVEALIRRTGHPRRAFRTLLAHAELDPRHRDDLDQVLDALPLTPRHWAVIGTSAMTSVPLLATAVRDVVRAFDAVAGRESVRAPA